MRICIVTPTPPRTYHGNAVTALRWQSILKDLGHQVEVTQEYSDGAFDVLVALHARKSAPSVERFIEAWPGAPVVVALTGTDLYPDLATSGVPYAVLDAAARLIVLQPLGIEQLPAHLRPRARVIFQSVPPLSGETPRTDVFQVIQLAHLRPVKDPFRLAEASRLLPPDSRIQVVHLGGVREPEMAERARQEMAINLRYRWLGEVPRPEALRVLARSRLLALTSKHEGGANAISEAVAASVPVISSRIPGSLGLLGPDYPGYFTPGNTVELACLLCRAETEPSLLDNLARRVTGLRAQFDPGLERDRWRSLLAEIA